VTCDVAEQLVSAALDDALSEPQAEALAQHQQSCASCRAFGAELIALRQRLRVEPVEYVPDVTAAVRTRLGSDGGRPAEGRRSSALLRVAAVFVAAFLTSAVVVSQLAPTPVLAENLGERVVAAQHAVTAMSADLEVIERGWHPDVPERRYTGTLRYRAPESMRVHLEDRTTYPSSRWLPNTTDSSVDNDMAWLRGLRPCPTTLQPSCSASGPHAQVWHNRAPFDEDVPAPLDLVVPAASFARTGPVGELGIRTIDGVDALGIRVTAAQAAPLLDGVLRVGNWREMHHSDVADVWLEATSLTPVAVEVRPADTAERRRWAAARGLSDAPDQPFLHVALRNVLLNEEVEVPQQPAPPAAAITDAGFVEDVIPDAVAPGWLPDGAVPHRAGRLGNVAVSTWTDGRAWVRVESTRSWHGGLLFGDIGDVVRQVDLGGTTAYTDPAGTVVGLHDAGVDVAVRGTYDANTLLLIAASIPVAGRPVPPDWSEATASTLQEAARLLPGLLVAQGVEGFAQPAVRADETAATISYVGAGRRAFRLHQTVGEVLSPPLDDDVLGVVVRGRDGRFTPSRGVLEWVESGTVVSLQSDSLGLEELVAIAELLRPNR
jgi:hypothetical protein